MFGIGGPEFVVILVIALIVFGPEKLPQMAGQVARTIRDFQRQASDMQATFSEAFSMAELEEQKKKQGTTATPLEQLQEPDSTGSEIVPLSAATASETVTLNGYEQPGELHPAFPISEMPANISANGTGEHGLAAHEPVTGIASLDGQFDPIGQQDGTPSGALVFSTPEDDWDPWNTSRPAPANETEQARTADYII